MAGGAVPTQHRRDAGAAWAGQYLYIWADPTPDNAQQGFLKVSANGGAFTAIDPNSLVHGAQARPFSGCREHDEDVPHVGVQRVLGAGLHSRRRVGGWRKTWTRISNTPNLDVVAVAGNTLYGELLGQQQEAIQTSTNNGASWKPLTLPPLPDGDTVDASLHGALLPAADGTIFAVDPEGRASPTCTPAFGRCSRSPCSRLTPPSSRPRLVLTGIPSASGCSTTLGRLGAGSASSTGMRSTSPGRQLGSSSKRGDVNERPRGVAQDWRNSRRGRAPYRPRLARSQQTYDQSITRLCI